MSGKQINVLTMKLNWRFESDECSTSKIASTGDKTMLRLSYDESINFWKCEALYKRTTICKNISSVAVWSDMSEGCAVNGCVSNVIHRAKCMGSEDKSNEFDFVAEFI